MVATAERRYARRTTSERRAERRAKLLAAGLDAFGTNGYRAASIEQLCSAAGVSTRNFYEEFAGREALLIELHDVLNDRAYQAVVEATAAVTPIDSQDPAVLVRRVEAGVRAYFEVMTSDARWARIALVESVGAGPEVEAARRAALGRFARFLADEAARLAQLGLAEERDFELTAVGLVGAINELVGTWPDRGAEPGYLDRLVAEAVRLILVALRGV